MRPDRFVDCLAIRAHQGRSRSSVALSTSRAGCPCCKGNQEIQIVHGYPSLVRHLPAFEAALFRYNGILRSFRSIICQLVTNSIRSLLQVPEEFLENCFASLLRAVQKPPVDQSYILDEEEVRLINPVCV